MKHQGLVVLIWAFLGLLLVHDASAKRTCQEKCQQRKNCGRCLNFGLRKKGRCECEWDGSTSKGLCKEQSTTESDSLFKSAVAGDVNNPKRRNRQTCKNWKVKVEAVATPTPTHAPSVPQCTDRSDCNNCLNNGCSWAFNGDCLESCSFIQDVKCITLEDQDDSGRKLLRFEDEASAKCADFDLYKKNGKKCSRALGCGHCTSIQLDVLPGSAPSNESCKWISNDKGPEPSCIGFCRAECPLGLDCSQPVCEASSPLDLTMKESGMCSDTAWECFEGQDVDSVNDALKLVSPKLEIQQVPEGSFVTEDYVCTRVRLFYNEGRIVVGVPKLG